MPYSHYHLFPLLFTVTDDYLDHSVITACPRVGEGECDQMDLGHSLSLPSIIVAVHHRCRLVNAAM